MLPDPVEVAQDEPHSDLGLLPYLAKERFVGDVNVLFADEQSHWCALSAASTLY